MRIDHLQPFRAIIHSKYMARLRYFVHYRPLAKLLEYRRGEILEVGALLGNGTRWMSHYGNVTAVDWWPDPSVERIFKEHTGHIKNLKVIKGNSNEVLPRLKQDYTFIFVDGGHSYSQVKKDITNCVPLLKEGGVLAGDDLDFQADEVDGAELERNKERELAFDPLQKKEYHPGVTAALWELFGRIPKKRVFWAARKVNGKLEPIAI